MGWEVEGPGFLTSRALELGIKQVSIFRCVHNAGILHLLKTLKVHHYLANISVFDL